MIHHLYAIADALGTPIGAWIKSCDVDARGGRGFVEFAIEREQAMAFPDLGAALAYWKRQSTVCPLRDDGRPNRPLTAYTVQPVPEHKEPIA